MLALSVRQPYAELILRGEKRIEYRTRPTSVRGRVYIYAPLRPGPAEAFALAKASAGDLAAGVIVGSVEIVGCQARPGGYEWLLARPRRATAYLRPTRQPLPMFFYPFVKWHDEPGERRT